LLWAAKLENKSAWRASIFDLSQTGHRSYSTTCSKGTVSFPAKNMPRRGGDHPLHLATKLKEEQSFMVCSSMNFKYVEKCKFSGNKNICKKFIYLLGFCYNNDICYHTFETPIWSFSRFVCGQSWFYTRKNIHSLIPLYGTVRIELTTLPITNLNFLFQKLIYLLMTMYYERVGIKITLCRDM
jgi:hypothetical protein